MFDGAVRAAQVGPIDIRAQVFAADGAFGGALDGRTAVCGHVSYAVLPLRNNRWRDAYFASQSGDFART